METSFSPVRGEMGVDLGSSVAEERSRIRCWCPHRRRLKLSKNRKEKKVVLFGGSIPTRKDGKLFNTCFVFDSDGTLIATHHKLHLFDVDIPDGITFFESKTLYSA